MYSTPTNWIKLPDRRWRGGLFVVPFTALSPPENNLPSSPFWGLTFYSQALLLIARRYEKTSTVFTSNKTFSQWNEVFADVTIASAILDRVLHHCAVINIKGESYRLKERKEFMRQKQQIVNSLFEQGNA